MTLDTKTQLKSMVANIRQKLEHIVTDPSDAVETATNLQQTCNDIDAHIDDEPVTQ
jgi:hypothetical protein